MGKRRRDVRGVSSTNHRRLCPEEPSDVSTFGGLIALGGSTYEKRERLLELRHLFLGERVGLDRDWTELAKPA